MLDYRVETFLVVCQEMNFTKAAKRLNITQPAVSNHIKQLEEYYDTLLFGYEGKKVYLTKEGKMLYEAMASMHNNVFYLKEQLAQLQNEKEEIRFGATYTIGEYMICDVLEMYMREHPSSSLHMNVGNTDELLSKLDAGFIDFAIIEGNFQKMNYENMLYSVEAFIPVCSPYSPMAGKSVAMNNILDNTVIISEKGTPIREILENALEEKNIHISDFNKITEIGNINTIKNLVKDNCGITFMYEKAVEEDIIKGELVKINLKGWKVKHEMCAVWKKDNIFSEYYERLLKELIV